MSLALLGATAPAAAAQSLELVQVVVTAVGTDDNPPLPVPRDTVVVFEEQQRRQVVDWVPVSGEPMSLALLIDDSVGSGFVILTRDKV